MGNSPLGKRRTMYRNAGGPNARRIEEEQQFDMAERGRRLTAFKAAIEGKHEVEVEPGEWRFLPVLQGDRVPTLTEELELE